MHVMNFDYDDADGPEGDHEDRAVSAFCDSPESEGHGPLNAAREHGALWVVCLKCGAEWHCIDTGDGPGFERVTDGDGYCER
jgi:hypothetical protein